MSCAAEENCSFLESHGKGTNDLVLLGSSEGVEEDVMADANNSKVLGESAPQPSMVLVCAFHNCPFARSLCSDEVSHELILLGSGTI
jgi:hypothetical protein